MVLVVLALRGATLVNKIAQTRPNPGVESEAAMSHEEHKLYSLIDRIASDVLKPILGELREIRHELASKRPHFTLTLNGAPMSAYAIDLGQTQNFVLGATASDGSTPTLSAQTLIASDPSMSVSQNTAADPSGNTFTCVAPATDTNTSFTLAGSASVVSSTSPTAQTITNTWTVTIGPSTTPVSFTLTLNESAPSGGAAAAAAHAHGAAGVSFPSPLKKV